MKHQTTLQCNHWALKENKQCIRPTLQCKYLYLQMADPSVVVNLTDPGGGPPAKLVLTVRVTVPASSFTV